MARPRQPQTCSHLIYTGMLTELKSTIRSGTYFLLAIFYASTSIGTLESDSLSLSTSSKTKLEWTLVYLFIVLQHKR